MCDVTARSKRPRITPRPRWWLLYGLAALMLGALRTAEVVALSHPARTAVQGALVLGGFAAMALWGRWNRAALDQQRWCACAGDTMTVRVIPSRRPAPARLAAVPSIPGSPLLEDEKVEAEEEVEAATR